MMRKTILALLGAVGIMGTATLTMQSCSQSVKCENVHAISNLAHSFSFYADGRFGQQYLKGHQTAMNWGNLYDFDFSNTNLLLLLACDDKSPYNEADFAAVEKFVQGGGGVLILGDPNGESQNKMAARFGARFEGETAEELIATRFTESPITSQGQATFLSLAQPKKWEVLVSDESGKSVLATQQYGKGRVVVGSRSIAGSHPNASDSINVELWKPLLVEVASGKMIDGDAPFNGKGWSELGNTETKQGLTISYTDYLAPYADAMFDISSRCMPVIEERMGVPLSGNMGSKIMLLATGGGGFSSGEMIALAVWWGGFPDREDSMIEFITHESVHSWVLPFPEIWNEPIATYVGNLVMIDMGHKEEAERRIADCINRARRADPDFNLYDMQGKSCKKGVADLAADKVNDVHWGKCYWIFEELRKENPTIVADYFKAKRTHALPEKITKYDDHNTVAVMSIAMGRDLFPWFRDIGFDVSRERAEIKF